MFKRSVRYFTLALTLTIVTAPFRAASAQPTDPCTLPGATCVGGGGDPQPIGDIVGSDQTNVVGGGDPQPIGDIDGGDDSLDNMILYLLVLYGLA